MAYFEKRKKKAAALLLLTHLGEHDEQLLPAQHPVASPDFLFWGEQEGHSSLMGGGAPLDSDRCRICITNLRWGAQYFPGGHVPPPPAPSPLATPLPAPPLTGKNCFISITISTALETLTVKWEIGHGR